MTTSEKLKNLEADRRVHIFNLNHAMNQDNQALIRHEMEIIKAINHALFNA